MPHDEALRTCIHNDKAIEFIQGIAKSTPVPPPLSTRFPDAPAAAIDLLQQLLAFDPAKRISAADALRHPWMAELHSLNSEPTAPPFDFAFENASDSELRDLLDHELRRFHPELSPSQVGFHAASQPATPPNGARSHGAADADQDGAEPADVSDPMPEEATPGSEPASSGSTGGGSAARKARATSAASKGSARWDGKDTAVERGGVGKRR